MSAFPSSRYAILGDEFFRLFDYLGKQLNEYAEVDERISRDTVAIVAALLVVADCILEPSA